MQVVAAQDTHTKVELASELPPRARWDATRCVLLASSTIIPDARGRCRFRESAARAPQTLGHFIAVPRSAVATLTWIPLQLLTNTRIGVAADVGGPLERCCAGIANVPGRIG